MKTTGAFRLSKQIKRSMACMLDPHRRGEFKRAMIAAQVIGSVPVRREKSSKDRAD